MKGESLLGSNKQVPWDCSVLLQSCTKWVGQERDVSQEASVPHFKGQHSWATALFSFFASDTAERQCPVHREIWKDDACLIDICCGIPERWTTSCNKLKITVLLITRPNRQWIRIELVGYYFQKRGHCFSVSHCFDLFIGFFNTQALREKPSWRNLFGVVYLQMK